MNPTRPNLSMITMRTWNRTLVAALLITGCQDATNTETVGSSTGRDVSEVSLDVAGDSGEVPDTGSDAAEVAEIDADAAEVPDAPSDTPEVGVDVPADVEVETLSTRLNPTGQTTCFDARGATPCPGPDAPFYGQDAQYATEAMHFVDNGDSTISDQRTGLTWSAAQGERISWEAALAEAHALELGGHDDWRLPTIKELYSLLDFSGSTGPDVANSEPYLDAVFPFTYGDEWDGYRMIDVQFWSSTEYVGTTMTGAHTVFGVNFADGRIKGYGTQSPRTGEAHSHFARYVRGNPEYGVNMFSARGEVVDDAATGLVWQASDSGEGLDWQDALAYCASLTLDGRQDWRLPNAKQLQSIVDYTRTPTVTGSAAIDPMFEVSNIESWYWSSTTHRDGRPETWGEWAVYVAFGQATGLMEVPRGSGLVTLLDVHGAGAQRSDPKTGDPADWADGHGPQGDTVRIHNYARCVTDR